jgi:hypothetical protein
MLVGKFRRQSTFDPPTTGPPSFPLVDSRVGEFVSIRLAMRKPHHQGKPFVRLDGQDWVVAVPGLDDQVEQAPMLPSTEKQDE